MCKTLLYKIVKRKKLKIIEKITTTYYVTGENNSNGCKISSKYS